MKKVFAIKLSFCIFALLATQELQAAPYLYSHASKSSPSVTSQLLGTRTYNPARQLVSEGDSSGKLTSYVYNSLGQLITTQDRNGNDIHNTYNDHEQLQTSWADQSATSIAPSADATDLLTPQYDSGDNQLTGSTYQQNQSAPQQITGDHYNLAGELSVKSYGSSKPLEQKYQYNLNGSTKSFTNVLNQTTNYTYTPMNQLYTVVFNGGTTTYTYDAFGRKLNETRPNGVQTNWVYDDYNGVKTMTSTGSALSSSFRAIEASRGVSLTPHNTTPQTLTQLGYTYYLDGNLHTETLGQNTTYTYQYNTLNQLQTFACTGSACPKDANGNTIENNTYTYTLNNGIQTITTKNTKGETNTATYNYYPSYPDRLNNITNTDNNINQGGTYV